MAKRIISKEVAEKIRAELKAVIGGGRAGLFPPHLDLVRRASGMEFEASDADTYSALLESICGATDDSQPVEQYDGTLGVTQAFVAAHQAPVGQLQWNNNLATLYTTPGDVSGVRWCTGTLISNDLFLSAGHCFDQAGGGWTRPLDNITGTTISNNEIATNMHVNFNYQVDPLGAMRVEQSYPILALVEYRLGGLDFSIVRLGGNPGATWGVTGVATTDATAGDMLCIIGHPAGWPKRIEAGPCLAVAGTTISYNDIDTLGGNSGSGVLRASDGRIVGVHTNGGCNAAGTGSNSGVRITSIIANSPTLQALTAPPTLKFRDDHITLKFRDDHITLKFIDDGVGTLPQIDLGGGTLPQVDVGGTLKHIDDVKLTSYDKGFSDRKLPGNDGMPYDPRPVLPDYGPGGATPFVLSTPHHSMAWASTYAKAAVPETPQLLAQYEDGLRQLESALAQQVDAVMQLDAQYRQLLAEYETLVRRGR